MSRDFCKKTIIDIFSSKIHIDCYSSKTNHSSCTEIILQYYRPEGSSVGRVIYARYSSDNQREESIEGQIRQDQIRFGKIQSEDQIRFLLSKYASLSTTVASHREKLIDSLIGSIILYDDGRIIITFNYRDKKTEANINDVVAACSSSGSDIAQDGSPNSNNPNFVIIGDAFGFSVYFDYDRYERR